MRVICVKGFDERDAMGTALETLAGHVQTSDPTETQNPRSEA